MGDVWRSTAHVTRRRETNVGKLAGGIAKRIREDGAALARALLVASWKPRPGYLEVHAYLEGGISVP